MTKEFPLTTFGPIGTSETPGRWNSTPCGASERPKAVGAWCEALVPDSSRRGRSYLRVAVDEFVEFASGERLTLRTDRGFTVSWEGPDDVSYDEFLHHLDLTLLPDEGEQEPEESRRSWGEYARALAAHGISVSPAELATLPYLTEVSPGLAERLRIT